MLILLIIWHMALSPQEFYQRKKKILLWRKVLSLEDPLLYKHAHQIIRRCISEEEMESILHHCHEREVGGHFGPTKIAVEITSMWILLAYVI